MNLAGLEDKITCPLLNLSATGKGKTMYDNARAFFDASTMYMPANEVPQAKIRRPSKRGCAAAQPMTVP
jgi:hypothetical protein